MPSSANQFLPGTVPPTGARQYIFTSQAPNNLPERPSVRLLPRCNILFALIKASSAATREPEPSLNHPSPTLASPLRFAQGQAAASNPPESGAGTQNL